MVIRPYEPRDADQVKAIFKSQGLPVYLPLPENDPCVISALVGIEGEKVVLALIGRLSVEAHCVMRPDEPDGARKVKRAQEMSEGYILALSDRMQKDGYAAVRDLQAFVPAWMSKFRSIMERFLGWLPEPQGYTVYYKRLGAGTEEARKALKKGTDQ